MTWTRLNVTAPDWGKNPSWFFPDVFGATYSCSICIVGDINDAWGVYRPDDGGNTWKRINDDKHQYAASTTWRPARSCPHASNLTYVQPGLQLTLNAPNAAAGAAGIGNGTFGPQTCNWRDGRDNGTHTYLAPTRCVWIRAPLASASSTISTWKRLRRAVRCRCRGRWR